MQSPYLEHWDNNFDGNNSPQTSQNNTPQQLTINNPFWVMVFQDDLNNKVIYEGISNTTMTAPTNGLVVSINSDRYKITSSSIATMPFPKSYTHGDFGTIINIRCVPFI